MKSRWMGFEELPEEVQPLATAYNRTVSPLSSTANVIRHFEGGDRPRLHIQTYGQVPAVKLRHLEILAGCRVEVKPIALNVLLVIILGGLPKGQFRRLNDDTPTNFLYREE